MISRPTLLLSLVFTLGGLAVLVNPPVLNSASFASLSDTLSSSRLSVAARLDASGTVVGGSTVQLKTVAAAPFYSTTTSNLAVGDTLTIGTGSYTITSVLDADEFTVTPVLAAGDADDNDPIYLKNKPVHTVTFNTASAVEGGYFRFLLPADATTPNDGNPDDQGFDFGGGSVTVTAADLNLGGGSVEYDFVAGVATASGGAGCTTPANYHCFEVHYSGTGSAGATITITVGSGADTPLAPAPGNTTEATAEIYAYVLRSYDSTDDLIDSSSGRIALIEPVKVTATIDPILEMTICGADTCSEVEPGDIVDGETLSVNTGATSTGTTVALGTLSSSETRLQAQKISVSTNAPSGYALTALDEGNLRSGTNTIDDNVTPPTSPAVLNTVGTEVYGLHPCGTHVAAPTWGTGSDSCTGGASTNAYSGTDSTAPLTLVNYPTGPIGTTTTYLLYKANISTTTAEGDYTHLISYTATGTF